MKVVKKIISIISISIIIVGIFTLTGCKKNEKKEEKPSILGAWINYDTEANVKYTFKSDGTGIYEFYDAQCSFKYKDKGDKLINAPF